MLYLRLLVCIVMLMSIFSQLHAEEITFVKEKKKSVLLAGGLSLIVPGSGQMYNRQIGKGTVMLGGAVLGATLYFTAIGDNDGDEDPDGDDALGTIGGIVYISTWSWSVVDALLNARNINKQYQRVSRLRLEPMIAKRHRLGARLCLTF